MEALVCRADFLLPGGGERIRDGYVLCEGERIVEAGPWTQEAGDSLRARFGERLQVIGGRLARGGEEVPRLRGVLLPAFVKAHGHDHEQPLIGIAKDEPLTAWLDHAVNPFTGFMNRERGALTAELGCSPQLVAYRMARLCDVHYGITASLVHHCNYNKYHLEDIAAANEAAGTTMICAVGSQDRFYVDEILDTPAEAIRRLDAAWELGRGLPRTSFCPGPDQDFSNSRALLVPLKRWAREHGTLFHIHSSEEPRTTAWFRESIEPGLTPVEYLHQIDALDGDTIVAHQVNCGPRDVEILARTGAQVAHNPLANTILGSGMPPVMELLKAGVTVAISTDGSGSADNQNILAAARLAAQYQKAAHRDATLLPSDQLLEMITSVPARMLRLEQGALRPGLLGDWIVVGLDRPNLTPTRLDNVVENLLWAADGSEVEVVVSRGRLLKHDGAVLPLHDGTTPAQVMDAVQHLSERFAAWRQTAPKLRGTGAHR